MVVMNDTQHIRDAVFFEGTDVRQRLSRFWILITLASIIAAAEVAADSTATVIGAMIVAPLMTPILGTMLSVVLADRTNLIRSLLHVAGGALVAVAIAAMIVAVSISLAATSISVVRDTTREAHTLAAARSFGNAVGWSTGNVTTRGGVVLVHMEGPPPLPNTDRLRTELEERGVDPTEVHDELVPARLVTFD
jgi:Domain of unknown function (DUF389)